MQFLTPNVQYRLKHGKSGHYTLHYTVQRNKRAKHLMFSKSGRFCSNIQVYRPPSPPPLLLPPPRRRTWFNWELTCQPARPISANITRLDEIIYTAPDTSHAHQHETQFHQGRNPKFPVNVVQAAPNVENTPDSDGINPDLIVHFNGKAAKITR